MSAPVATIGVPVFNGARFLDQCLESARAQSVTDLEILIADNGSTDGTAAICRRHASQDSRIVYLPSDTNHGAAWNHNRLIEAAHAPLFKWLGADDYLAPRFIEACANALERRPDAVMCFPGTTVVDDAGETILLEDPPLPLDSPDVVTRFAALLAAWKPCHCPFYGLFRTASLRRAPRLGAYLGADRVFLAGLALHGPFAELPERLFFRRKHSGNRNLAPAEQQAIYAPGAEEGLDLRETRLFVEQLSAVAAAALPAGTKVSLARALLRWVVSGRATLAKELRAAGGQALRRAWLLPQRPVNKEIRN